MSQFAFLQAEWSQVYDSVARAESAVALIHEPIFKQAAGEGVFSKARVINTPGTRAVHGHRAIPARRCVCALKWLQPSRRPTRRLVSATMRSNS